MLSRRRDQILVLILLAVAGWLGWRWWRGDELAYVRVGASPGGARAALVLLHGYGAPGNDLVGLAHELAAASPDVAFVVPAGPHAVGIDGRSWIPEFTESSREAFARHLVREVEATRAGLWKIIEDLHERGLAYRDIYIGGFSLGGRMAIEVAIRAPIDRALGGLVAMSAGGMMELPDPVADGRPALRVLVSHGTQDPIIGAAHGRHLAHALAAAGHDVRFLRFDGPHTIPPEVRAAIPAFLEGDAVGDPVTP